MKDEEDRGGRLAEIAFKVIFPLVSTALASAVRVIVENFLGR